MNSILIVIVVILIILLFIRKKHDYSSHKTKIELFNSQINSLREEAKNYEKAIKQSKDMQMTLEEAFTRNSNSLNISYEERKRSLENFLQEYEKESKSKIDLLIENYRKQQEEQRNQIEQGFEDFCQRKQEEEAALLARLSDLRDAYENSLIVFKKIEEEENALYHYTIWISDKDKKDIFFLLNEVIDHLNNPDILYKLIWTEYIQKATNEMLKRAEIEEVSGIYKITNLTDKKCYIGKSTNIKRRLQEHVKGSLGISTIADQKVHEVMRKEGLWNFTFEKVCECPKDQLSEKEKYYITFFNATTWGYNVMSGG